MKTIGKKEVAYTLGVSTRTVTTYQQDTEDPLPVKSSGKGTASTYDLREFVEWYLRKQLASYGTDGDGIQYSLEDERARLIHLKANKAELEVQVLKGDFVSIKEVDRDIKLLVYQLRSHLLALPTRIARVAFAAKDIHEIEKAAQDIVYAALDELVKGAGQYEVGSII